MKLQLRTRFIHVGVDTSRYALLIGGRSLYPPCVSQITVSTFCVFSGSVCLSVLVIVCVKYPRYGYVL